MDVVTGEIKGYDVRSWDNLPGKGDMILPFDLQTPWTYNVSLGYTVGKSLALGAEYEYQDYSSMKFKDTEGNSSAYEFENSTTSMLKGVSTVRLGLEYKVIPQFAFRAGYNYSTAAFHQDAFKDLAINSIQTDTDFSNSKSLSNYTLVLAIVDQCFMLIWLINTLHIKKIWLSCNSWGIKFSQFPSCIYLC